MNLLQKESKQLYINMICLIVVFFYSTTLLSQLNKLGTPRITNHGNKEISSGVEIWDIGKVYGHLIFGSNAGLMCYNGDEWLTFSTPKNTIIRSLSIKSHDTIYVGAQNEVGFFSLDNHDKISYTSIKENLDLQYQNLSEVWNIEWIDESVFFNSESDIICYTNGKTSRYGQNSWIDLLKKVDNKIWYHALHEGIYVIDNDQEELIEGSELFNGKNLVDIIKTENDTNYIVTEKHGIYIWSNNNFDQFESRYTDFLRKKEIISIDYDEKWGFLIGTKLGGFINITANGEARFHLSKNTGLLNNRINSIKLLDNGILWLASNSGVDEVDLSNYLFKFFPDNELEGAVYDIDVWNGRYFFSTSNGLYTLPVKDIYESDKKNVFSLVSKTNGQTWGTQIINGHLYCAHHQGPLQITPNFEAQKIKGASSAWKFIPLKDDLIALGHFNGINIYKQAQNGALTPYSKVENLNESSRILVFDDNENLWMSHPYKYVYKINFSEDLKHSSVEIYDQDDGIGTNDKNYVFDLNGECYLTNMTGIYRFDNTTQQFELCPFLNKYFDPGTHVRRLIQNQEDLYLITNEATTHFRIEQSGLETQLHLNEVLNIPSEDYIGGFEELIPYEDAIFVSTGEGMNYYKHIHNDYPNEPEIKKIKILSQNDSVVYNGIKMTETLDLSYKQNALSFYISEQWPKSNNKLSYSYRISGVKEEWSHWQKENQIDIYNLKQGEYLFEFKSKDIQGRESLVKSIQIKISPPVYLAKWALGLYLLFGTGLIFAGIFIPKKQYEKNTAKLEDENKKHSEELKVMRKEKIDSEIEFKNRELASTTLHLVKKNQTLNKLSDMIVALKKDNDNKGFVQKLNKMLSTIKHDINEDEEWDNFNFYFDQVHQRFVENLKNKYPNLSKNDFKLCAFLRMNLSSKEIAPLLNISVRGVEISRYRLRKKLGLERQTNLNDFLNSDVLNI